MGGGRLSKGEETENHRHLADFKSCWNGRNGITSNIANGLRTFTAMISYTWNGKTKSFTSGITMHSYSGPDDGMVDIDATRTFPITKFHLRFYPVFQHYRYDEDEEALIISGSSDKMKGDYEVKIVPIET